MSLLLSKRFGVEKPLVVSPQAGPPEESTLLNRRVEVDPIPWCRRVLRFYPWSKQIELSNTILEHNYVACRSANGTGKSAFIAALALHFAIKNRHDLQAHCAIVSHNSKRLKATTLKWLRIHHTNGGLPGHIRNNNYELDGDKEKIGWYTPIAGEESSNSLQGVHAENLLILVDEAGEVSRTLWEQIISLDTTDSVKIVAVGNPTSTGTPFHECFSKPTWVEVHMSAYDTPMVALERGEITEDGIEHPSWRRGFMSLKKLEQKRIEYTEPVFKARCEGEFPEISEHSMIDPDWISRSQDWFPGDEKYKQFLEINSHERVLAVDPGSGGDPTVVKFRVGQVVQDIDIGNYRTSSDREEVGEYIAEKAIELGAKRVVFDAFGVGMDHSIACTNKLRDCHSDIIVHSLNTGDQQKVVDKMFLNPRAELGWEFRRLMQNDLILLPPGREVVWQIKELRQKPHISGRLALEPKDTMKKRLGRSPDDLDTILLSLYGNTAQASGDTFDEFNS